MVGGFTRVGFLFWARPSRFVLLGWSQFWGDFPDFGGIFPIFQGVPISRFPVSAYLKHRLSLKELCTSLQAQNVAEARASGNGNSYFSCMQFATRKPF